MKTGPRIDLVGKKFGRLTVISFYGKNKRSQSQWNCTCECGNEKVVLGWTLSCGDTKSCGCLQKEIASFYAKRSKHQMCFTRTYKTWDSLKQRCYIPNSTSYKYYGARGIKICDRWLKDFNNFLEDMGERPIGKSIERVDNDGDYEPGNCTWATSKEQANNRRTKNLVAQN